MGDRLWAVCNQSPRSTRPSIPRRWINQVLACLAGVRVWCVHLFRMAGSSSVCDPYGRWHPLFWGYLFRRAISFNYCQFVVTFSGCGTEEKWKLLLLRRLRTCSQQLCSLLISSHLLVFCRQLELCTSLKRLLPSLHAAQQSTKIA